MQPQLSPSASFSSQTPQAFITPSMWRDAVASSFEDGLKRRWGDYSSAGLVDDSQPIKRAR